MEEADQLWGRLAIIDRGKIVAEGTPAALKAAIGADVVTIRIPRDTAFEVHRDRALALARTVAGVEKATACDEGVSAHATDGGAALLELLRKLDSEGIPMQEVAVARPSLDEVFLQHTGRAMRPEEGRPP